MEELNLDEVIEATEDLSAKLKHIKEVAKDLKKVSKKETKPREKKTQKIKRVKEDIKLFRGGLNFYLYRENAVKAGFQNPNELTLKEIIKDLYEPKPKKERAVKKQNFEKVGDAIIYKIDDNGNILT